RHRDDGPSLRSLPRQRRPPIPTVGSRGTLLAFPPSTEPSRQDGEGRSLLMRRMLVACCLVLLAVMPVVAKRGGHGKGPSNKSCDAEALAAAQAVVDDACDCDD